MAHCSIPVIDHLRIDNTGSARRGAVLQLDVVSVYGSHGGPREIHLDLAAHTPTVLRDAALLLDPAAMLAVDAPRPGSIRAVLRDADGNELARAIRDVTILAGDQWKATPPQLALEMLAAHVQPNAAAVSALLLEVSDWLGGLTGNPSINGYQADDPDRVDAIAHAVFETMRARDIRYAEPPASWGMDGQKIRTPAEVLDGRLGTCLDLALTMAAVLEQAGINSTIWVLRNHAFLGYWRTDAALPTVSTTEAVDVVNLVDLDRIRLVETTLLTGGAAGGDFAAATAAPRGRYLAGDLSDIVGITDVRQSRSAQIYPLPSRVTDLAGNVTVTEYQPAAVSAPTPQVRAEVGRLAVRDTSLDSTPDPTPDRVRQWKNALLDLSLRNRLINYTERAGFALAVPGAKLADFEDRVNAGERIELLASDEVSSVDAARGIRYGRDLSDAERTVLLADKRSVYIDITDAAYKTRLRNLAYKARTIVQETGANSIRHAQLEARRPRVALADGAGAGDLGDEEPRRALPAHHRRGRRLHAELLPGGKAAPGVWAGPARAGQPGPG